MDPFTAKLVAAATGSTLTALTMTPFDVLKTRLQTQLPRQKPLFTKPPANACCQPKNVPCVRNMSSFAARPVESEVVCVWEEGVMRPQRVNGFADAARHVWKAEGVRGLWKGAGTSLVIGVPSSTCYMLTYDYLLHSILPSLLPDTAVVALPLTAGVLARASITSLMSPLELIRTNLQSTPMHINNPHTLRSVTTSVQEMVRSHGVGYLYRGLGPSLWRDVPFSGIYWAGYEGLKSSFARKGQTGAAPSFISGAVSGTVAAWITSPFDVLKTRRQALIMSNGRGETTATMRVLTQIIKTEGVQALFAGIGPRTAKIAPACGIMISCYEGVSRYLAQKET